MKRSDRPFVVGRRTRKGTTVVLLPGARKPAQPIRGPWTLRAVVTPDPAR
ncbi:MAG: hypothetical protein GWM90_13710 [Gemmatimonadetes bacterium]|nr:hypothetical protein [Gemmatimonadota bacterium]NIQ54870.1 hypothetical protein [Gemmatimonadota bacterium]NIU75068.1 hypothetical protein [Gammaproteobacteria bacterium]NIX45127.1 hypothetical protein [Gemmatimonadota bacterium]NIY09378.1 hypothetical protein [Gemmatimonadota bacterium]